MSGKKRVSSGKDILKRLDEAEGRGAVSLYLDKELYKRFKKACGKVPASKVMEELMREFLGSLDG
jgi:hypothetical protein